MLGECLYTYSRTLASPWLRPQGMRCYSIIWHARAKGLLVKHPAFVIKIWYLH